MTTLTVKLPDALNDRFQRAFHPAEPGALVLRLLEEAIEREEALRGIIEDLPSRPLTTEADLREAREEGRG